MSDHFHSLDFQALINLQEASQQMCRICRDTISEQRRICSHLCQIPDAAVRRRRVRRLQTRPARTSRWWDNFVEGVADENAWRENFCMSKDAFVVLSTNIPNRIPHILQHYMHADFLSKTLV
ncbi:hypothetical protein NL108_008961 [Boleophthalmus pectinirostris]|nr:hypothetical protein NL108_008961 [Boleophthalmus pectinirostris]